MLSAPKQNCMRNLEHYQQSSILSKKPSALFPPKPSIRTGFVNALQTIVMLISWTALSGLCVRLMYKSGAIFWADFLLVKGRIIHK